MTDQELKDLVANLAVSHQGFKESLIEQRETLREQSESFSKSLKEQSESLREQRETLREQSESFSKSLKEQSESLREQREALKEQRETLREQSESFSKSLKEQSESLREQIESFSKSLKEQSESLREQSESFSKSLKEQSESFSKSLKEQREAQREQSESFNKSLIELKESIIEQKESLTKLSKESDKQLEKIKQVRRSMRDLRQLGVIDGFDPEEFFYESFSQYPTLGNIKFDHATHHVKSENAEFDIVLYNTTQIGIVEVKNRLKVNRLKEFVKKIPIFRNEFTKYKDFKIIAAVAAYSFEKESDQLAQNMGLYVFSRYGQKLRPLHGDTFVAKEF
jgi:myosin heavy subunit